MFETKTEMEYLVELLDLGMVCIDPETKTLDQTMTECRHYYTKRHIPFRFLPGNWFKTKGYNYYVDELCYLLNPSHSMYKHTMLFLKVYYGIISRVEYEIEWIKLGKPDQPVNVLRLAYLQSGDKVTYINGLLSYAISVLEVDDIEVFIEILKKYYIGTENEVNIKIVELQYKFNVIQKDEYEKSIATFAGKPWWNLDLSYNEADGSTTVTLDYNTYFVAEMRKRGYTGTDDEVVDDYIADYYKTCLREDYNIEEEE